VAEEAGSVLPFADARCVANGCGCVCWRVENRGRVYRRRSSEGVHGIHYLLLNGGGKEVKLAGAHAMGKAVEGRVGQHPAGAAAAAKSHHRIVELVIEHGAVGHAAHSDGRGGLAVETKVYEAIGESVALRDRGVPQVDVVLRCRRMVTACPARPMTTGVVDVAVVPTDVEETVVGESSLPRYWRRLTGEGTLQRGVVARRQQRCGCSGCVCRGGVSVEMSMR
jgi:hypothetical protein